MKNGFNYESDDVLKKLQSVQFDILINFNKFCIKHNLQYYVIGGALLGAARYGTLIPWDDDIDVAMPRDSYEKFEKLFLENPIEDLFLQSNKTNPKFSRCIMKLRKNNTSIIEYDSRNVKMHNGIYIDIFPIDYLNSLNENKICRRAKKIRILMSLRAIKNGYLNNNYVFLKKILRILLFILPNKLIDAFIKRICIRENNKENRYAILWLHNYNWDKQIHEISILGNNGVCELYGIKFKAPQNIDSFLSNVFGKDYIKEPNNEMKHQPHSFIHVDFNK